MKKWVFKVCKTSYSVNRAETKLAQTPFIKEKKPTSPTLEEASQAEPEENIMLDGNLVQENRSGSQKVTSEQLMIQQMSLMTQMMGIMAGNMQKKDSIEEKIAEESEVTRIPVRNSMYRRSQRS